MWLEMLEDPTLTQLEYDDLRSKSNKTELTEMVVKMMGAHGTKMDGCLPFSWIIKEQVSKLINQHIQRDCKYEFIILSHLNGLFPSHIKMFQHHLGLLL